MSLATIAPPSPWDMEDDPERAVCGCPVDEFSPAVHEGQRYCMNCDSDIPVELSA